jgi:hypothetical protein
MESNDMLNTWEEGNKKLFSNTKISTEMIEQYLKPKISKTSAIFTFNLIFYCIFQLAAAGILIADIIGYKTNPTMLSALIPLLVVTVGFLVFGYFSFLKIREINNYSENLMLLLSKKLSFLRTYYETWMVIISFSTLIMIFALSTMVDNQEGYFRINNPLKYIIISISVWLFIYGTQKLSSLISTRELKGYLNDLQNNFLEESQKIERQKKKFRWFLLFLALVFTALFVLGLLKSMHVI